jgi:hypothetical protein
MFYQKGLVRAHLIRLFGKEFDLGLQGCAAKRSAPELTPPGLQSE